MVFFAGMIGTLLVLTLYLQFGEHFSAIHAGLTLAPFAVGSAIGATLAAAVLVPRFGRAVLQVGASHRGRGLVAPGRHRHPRPLHHFTFVGPAAAHSRAGHRMLISPLFGFILSSVTDDEVGSASGVLNACQHWPAPSAWPCSARSSLPPSVTPDSSPP